MKRVEVVTVNTGVPIPEHYERYPFDQLGVGDSFEFKLSKRSSVQSRVSRLNQKGERQFIVRKIDDTTGGVWRVDDKKMEE